MGVVGVAQGVREAFDFVSTTRPSRPLNFRLCGVLEGVSDVVGHAPNVGMKDLP